MYGLPVMGYRRLTPDTIEQDWRLESADRNDEEVARSLDGAAQPLSFTSNKAQFADVTFATIDHDSSSVKWP